MEEFGAFDTLDSTGDAESSEQSEGRAEKQQEQAKKAMSGIRRTQRDQRKARKQEDVFINLFTFFLQDAQYDELVQRMLPMLQKWLPPSLVLGACSLVHNQVSLHIRKMYEKPLPPAFSYQPTAEVVDFDDSNLDLQIQTRINAWFEDMVTLMTQDSSLVVTQKTLSFLQRPERDHVMWFFTFVFGFFLSSLHIRISESHAKSYARFLLLELAKKMQAALPQLEIVFEQEDISD